MFSRDAKFAVLAILGILAVFMFHAASGPFSVVYGPATAFRALRSALLLMLAMMAFALGCVRKCTTVLHLPPRFVSLEESEHPEAADRYSVLLR